MSSSTRPLSLTRHGARNTAGNSALTTVTGAILIVLLAPLGVTILRIGQLTWLHLFLGLLLIGPVALKLASTGYRFTRYYTRDRDYAEKGPPPALLRLLAPLLVLSTVVVFGSGVILLLDGPTVRSHWMLVHKASFIVWLAVAAVHVIGHLPELARMFGQRVDLGQVVGPELAGLIQADNQEPIALGGHGAAGRWIALASALVLGLVLVLLLAGHFSAWTQLYAPSH